MKNRLILIFVASLILSLSVASVSFAYADKDVSQTFYGTASNRNELYICPDRSDYNIQAHNFYGTINFYATQGYPVVCYIRGNHGDGTSYWMYCVDGEPTYRSWGSNNDHLGSGWEFTDRELVWTGNYGQYLPKKFDGRAFTVRDYIVPAPVMKNYNKGKITFDQLKAQSNLRVTINVRQNPSEQSSIGDEKTL